MEQSVTLPGDNTGFKQGGTVTAKCWIGIGGDSEVIPGGAGATGANHHSQLQVVGGD